MKEEKDESDTEFFKKSVVREPKLYKNWGHGIDLKSCPYCHRIDNQRKKLRIEVLTSA